MRLPDVLAALRQDVVAMTGGPGRSWARRVALAVLLPQVRAVAYYRVGHLLAGWGLLPVAYALRARAVRVSGAEIHPQAVIGPGLNLVHPVGVVIGAQVRVGARAWIYQGVTLGSGVLPGQPVLGDDVAVFAGAKVLGGVTVGDGAVVGANAVVVRGVPAGAVARGVPAVCSPRVVG